MTAMTATPTSPRSARGALQRRRRRLRRQRRHDHGDGYVQAEDCDEDDALINPGATEIPGDGVDNDCDPSTADADQDGDGFTDNDCDDSDANTYPGAPEQCDDKDNDCNDLVDDGIASTPVLCGTGA